MTRFYLRQSNIPVIGRLGDSVPFLDLASELQTEEMAALVGALRTTSADVGGVEVCGSPSEASTTPELGYHYAVYSNPAKTKSLESLDHPIPSSNDPIFVLENIALNSVDQLRQRMAWSLANIFTISMDVGFADHPDGWTSYYDSFVRNAFGNFNNILRDVSYHPLMGNYLTYTGNKAYAVQGSYPDENYAREIMQLYSIGLWKLNDDGTRTLDASGNPIEAYTNADILDFARIWTGFDRQRYRTNTGMEEAQFGTPPNYVDPMQIRPQWRDRLPKAKLDSGFIGDQYPLCDELPPQSFLRKGARYEYTGDFSVEGDLLDQEVGPVGLRGRFTPTPNVSALHKVLCAPSATNKGACTFPLRVTLTSNLGCKGTQECNADRILSVKVVDPVANVTKYYSYVPPACVRLTFFNSGQLLKRASTRAQCANPAQRVAAPVCCKPTSLTRAASNYTSECLFANEVTDYATAAKRCNALGLSVCSSNLTDAASFAVSCASNVYMWTSGTCNVQIQVYPSGQIGIIDPSTAQFKLLLNNSNNVFRVRWSNNVYPVATSSGVCPVGCTRQVTPNGNSCICSFTVGTGAVYSFASLATLGSSPSTAANTIGKRLAIGASDPTIFNPGTYVQCVRSECQNLTGVTVWLLKTDPNGTLSDKAIFQLPPFRVGGRVRYLFNRQSIVKVGNFTFQNPPHFAPLLGELNDFGTDYTSDTLWTRQAEYEVEALLEHLSEHQNTAPFVAYRLIQQLVTSNPTQRYVKAVVDAFRSGTYGSLTFTGKYGDLGAAVYAILMDREARTPLLEADKTYGMLKDPLIKLYQLMRSLGYKSPRQREVALYNLINRIGVQPFGATSVFGFYLPEYSPAGPIANAGLVSPVSQLATAPNLLGFLNGATSLIDLGLTSCDSGFGVSQNTYGRSCGKIGPEHIDGSLTYVPPASNNTAIGIVDDLNLLLTAGRLNKKARDTLVNEYNAIANKTTAVNQVVKLIVASPEYQTNTLNVLTTTQRQAPPVVPGGGRRFKAIVVIFEIGGFDSYSLIVPHSNCTGKDYYAEYATVRQGAALNKTAILPIDVPAGQPCRKFGVHPAMPQLKQLYTDKDAMFVANIGAMVEPITKDEYNKKTKRVPPSLFAHNIMQRSVQNVYAQDISSEGILGRITDAVVTNAVPYKSAIYSFAGKTKMVQGSTPADFLSPTGGVIQMRDLTRIRNGLNNLTQYVSESIFAETYSDALFNSLLKSESLGSMLSKANLSTTFGNSGAEQQFAQVAKLIKMLPVQEKVERAVFFTQTGGFDTHNTFDLAPTLSPIDTALGKFAQEMKAQGRWDDVVVISASDFARTLASNGKGTDHAWGGNHFVAGGKVNGGRILGQYPATLTDEGELSLGRGRLIPTTPFEAVWKGIAEWFGVTPAQMAEVLPNAANFPASQLFNATQMFLP